MNSLSDLIIDPITLEPFKDAQRTDCGHRFSLSSAISTFGTVSGDICVKPAPCPLCRKRVVRYAPDHQFQELVDGILNQNSKSSASPAEIKAIREEPQSAPAVAKPTTPSASVPNPPPASSQAASGQTSSFSGTTKFLHTGGAPLRMGNIVFQQTPSSVQVNRFNFGEGCSSVSINNGQTFINGVPVDKISRHCVSTTSFLTATQPSISERIKIYNLGMSELCTLPANSQHCQINGGMSSSIKIERGCSHIDVNGGMSSSISIGENCSDITINLGMSSDLVLGDGCQNVQINTGVSSRYRLGLNCTNIFVDGRKVA